MLFIKIYYVFFSAFIYAIAGICQILSWINRLPLEEMFSMRLRYRKSFLSTLRLEERMLQLKHLF